jgi:MtN3 and saliva related transmembrane protein
MVLGDVVGYIAGACTTIAFVPQAWKVYRTKHTHDLSLGMFLLSTIGVACWLAYGITRAELPIIIPNAVTLVLSSYVLAMKIRHG